MSTNDDSTSRRGRRADQGAADRRAPSRQDRDERWDQSSSRNAEDRYQDQHGRDSSAQRAAYSAFSKHSYAPPRQEPPSPPPPPQQQRYDAPQVPQGYYQEPVAPRPAPPAYVPPPPAYEPEPSHLGYADNSGYGESTRNDLFGRDPSPLGYEQNPYGAQGGGYHSDPYDQGQGRPSGLQAALGRAEEPGYMQRDSLSPVDDYERNFASRGAPQENQASRFFLPEEQVQPQQRPADRYAAPMPQPSQSYNAGGYGQQAAHDNYDPRYAAQESWGHDDHGLHGDDIRGGLPQRVPQGDELDEDFFADDDDFEHDHQYPEQRRGRKKLILVALASAIAVGGGGAYVYKMMKGRGGDSATPFIRADNRPSKEIPGNPGGKQFPNGEKAIYDRLTPDGPQIQTASLAASPSFSMPQAVAAPPTSGNSLEDRIEEALKKAQKSGDAPTSAGAQPQRGPDQPTVVRSESYRPDGTRVEAATRPLIQPNFSSVNNGGLPAPFGTPVAAPLGAAPPAPFRAAPAPSLQPPQQMAATAAPAPAPRSVPAPTRTASIAPASEATAGGFYVSLKSAPDEKAIQRDLASLSDKYKSVLGDVQLSSKIADLGAKGVTYRAVAGPLGSRQEAMDLCTKIKGVGGDKACFVTN